MGILHVYQLRPHGLWLIFLPELQLGFWMNWDSWIMPPANEQICWIDIHSPFDTKLLLLLWSHNTNLKLLHSIRNRIVDLLNHAESSETNVALDTSDQVRNFVSFLDSEASLNPSSSLTPFPSQEVILVTTTHFARVCLLTLNILFPESFQRL